MKKELYQTIEIPEGIEAEIEGSKVIVKGKEGTNERKFDFSNLSFEKKGNEIIIGNKKSSKKEKRRMNTIAAHIKNMIGGAQKVFEYKLKICFSHFPITVEIKGNEALVKNFLGERTPRKVKIPKGAEVKVDKEIVTVTSPSIETAGQAAANFENVTRIVKRDRYPVKVMVGFKQPEKAKPALISNVKGLKGIEKGEKIIIAKIGKKKKIEIAKLAKEKGIIINNLSVNKLLKKAQKAEDAKKSKEKAKPKETKK
nr:large subunit ribosomal protein L6 [uncultured archaeon]